jgi:hypothetical protein
MAEVDYLTKNGVKSIVQSGRSSFNEDPFIFQILEIKSFVNDPSK